MKKFGIAALCSLMAAGTIQAPVYAMPQKGSTQTVFNQKDAAKTNVRASRAIDPSNFVVNASSFSHEVTEDHVDARTQNEVKSFIFDESPEAKYKYWRSEIQNSIEDSSLVIDMRKAYTIDRISYAPQYFYDLALKKESYSVNGCIREMVLQVSDDGQTWRNVSDADGLVMTDYDYPKEITFTPETARYVKISAKSATTWDKKESRQISVGKLKIFGKENGEAQRTNVALQKPVTTVNGERPELAVDGVIETGDKNWWEAKMFQNGNSDWTAKGEPLDPKGYITINLQQTHLVDEIITYGYWEDSRSFAYTISTSMDGEIFTPVVDKKLEDGANTKDGIHHKIEPVNARYIRMQPTDSNAAYPCAAQIREIEVMGVPSDYKGDNLAAGKTVKDAATQNVLNGMTDEDETTNLALKKNQTIDLDLENLYALECLDVLSDASADHPVNFTLRGSKDGVNYGVLVRDTIDAQDFSIALKNYRGMHLRLSVFDDITISELEAYGVETQMPSADVNIASGKKVTAVNTENGHGPEQAVDGDINSYWAGGALNSYITVDLGGYYSVNKMKVVPYFDGKRAYKYTMSLSTDGKRFVPVASKEDESIATKNGTVHEIEPKTARYVRLTMTDHLFSDNKSVHVNDFAVYGTEADFEPEDIAFNKTISKGAESLINDDYLDEWTASALDEEIVLDLEKIMTIDEVELVGPKNKTNTYVMMVSEDGENYDVAAQKSGSGTVTFPLSFTHARYVKFSGNTEGQPLSMNEIVLRGIEKPVAEDGDIAFLKPVRTNFGAEGAENVTDQNPTTVWNAQYYPCNVDIDLMGTYDVDSAKIQVMPKEGYFRYSIYTSKDGKDFTRAYRKDDRTPVGEDGVMEADLTNAKGVRFVRVQFEYSSTTANMTVGDVRLYGKKVSADKPYREELTYTDFEETEYAKDITDQEVFDYVDGVVTRLFGEQYVDWFEYELKDKDAEKDFFEISDHNGKIHIAGNEGLSLTSGLYYYLKNYENVLVTEVEVQGDLGDAPEPVNASAQNPLRKENLYDIRYAYNYCTNSYTMAFFGEDEWQRELDWLALNGVNLILDLNGQEAVWHNFLKKAGYTDEQAKDWIAGPAYYAWQFMSNLETINGPVNNDWIEARLDLARKNQYKMRVLGMDPVLQAFSGEVPTNIRTIDPDIDVVEQAPWSAFDRPSMIRTVSEDYQKYAKMFYDAQREVLGSDSPYYATDPFHEGGTVADMSLEDIGLTLFNTLRNHNKDAVWVVQSWNLDRRTISKIPYDDKQKGLLVLDLNADQDPRYHLYNEFDGTPWVWCVLDNYGGKHGIQAELETIARQYSNVYQKTNHLTGIGMTPEGSRLNTVQYDLLFEIGWENGDIDLSTWLDRYVERRYGIKDSKEIPNAQAAWDILQKTVYRSNKPEVFAGPDTIINFSPRFGITELWPWGREVAPIYDQKQFEEAAELLMEDYDKLKDNKGFQFDAADMVREYLSNTAMQYYQKFTKAYKDNDRVAFDYYADRFMSVIDLTDQVLGTHEEFLVGSWIQKAKDLGVEYNLDDHGRDMVERNARALITTWGTYRMSEQEFSHEGTTMWGGGVLVDYANRQYAGLTKDYYGKRWQIWIDGLKETFGGDYKDFTFRDNFDIGWNWSLDQNDYTTETSGDIQALANEAFLKYGLDDDYRVTINITHEDGSKETKDLFAHKGVAQDVVLAADQAIESAEGSNVTTSHKGNVLTINDITANTTIEVRTKTQPVEADVDVQLLEMVVNAVKSVDLNDYLDKGKAELQSALDQAEPLLNNAQSQKEVDEAAAGLNRAWLEMRLRPDEDLLAKLKEEVQK